MIYLSCDSRPFARGLAAAALALAAFQASARPAAAESLPTPAGDCRPAAPAGQFVSTPGPVSPAGVRAACDLPTPQHMRNTGGSDGPRGPGSGSGLCVPTSVEMVADWHHVTELKGFQADCTHRPGGSFPEKLERDIAAYCQKRGKSPPKFAQHTGGDEAVLDLAMKTGRMAGITYCGRDNLYAGNVPHMVCLVHLDADRGCIVDNNRPGQFVWMSRRELLTRWKGLTDDGRPTGMPSGWAVVFLAPPPPPYATAPAASPPPVMVGSATDPAGARFGVEADARLFQRTSYRCDGVECGREAFAAALADDSDRPHLSLVGFAGRPGADRLVPAAAADRLHVQHYEPGDWQVSQFGLADGATGRRPAVHRVGAEVGRLANAQATPEAVADLADELLGGRRPARPPLLPRPFNPLARPMQWLAEALAVLAVLLAAAALALLLPVPRRPAQ